MFEKKYTRQDYYDQQKRNIERLCDAVEGLKNGVLTYDEVMKKCLWEYNFLKTCKEFTDFTK